MPAGERMRLLPALAAATVLATVAAAPAGAAAGTTAFEVPVDDYSSYDPQ
jgi:hypothetical protein